MVLKKCDMKIFSQVCAGKEVACYGIGGEFERIVKNYIDYEWMLQIAWLVDANPNKVGEIHQIGNRTLNVTSLNDFLNQDMRNVVLLVTCTAFGEVVEQLNTIEQLNQVECYLFHFMFGLSEKSHIPIRHLSDICIPPSIHYCWFGGKPLPDRYREFIASWKKYCSGYEIVEWNEKDFDIGETAYTKEAYEAEKYGFVPDYFRLKIIYEHGGIYLDTDVEVLKNLDDLRYNHAFCGLEFPGEVNFGLGFGAEKGNPTIAFLMERYRSMHFLNSDGSRNETISPVFQTEDLMKCGMQYGTKLQNVGEMTVYPIEVLSPKNIITGEMDITPYSYTVHHYDGTWVTGAHLECKNKRKRDVEKIRKQFRN